MYRSAKVLTCRPFGPRTLVVGNTRLNMSWRCARVKGVSGMRVVPQPQILAPIIDILLAKALVKSHVEISPSQNTVCLREYCPPRTDSIFFATPKNFFFFSISPE